MLGRSVLPSIRRILGRSHIIWYGMEWRDWKSLMHFRCRYFALISNQLIAMLYVSHLRGRKREERGLTSIFISAHKRFTITLYWSCFLRFLIMQYFVYLYFFSLCINPGCCYLSLGYTLLVFYRNKKNPSYFSGLWFD